MATFGKSFEFSFSARDGEKLVPAASLVGARIYDADPTETQIDDAGDGEGDSVVTEVTTWSDGDSDYEKLIGFDAISDSDTHSTDRYEVYYVVVNYKYDTGGDTVFSVHPIIVYRPHALSSRFGVTEADVLKVESLFSNTSTDWILDKINLAEELVESDLAVDDPPLELHKLQLSDAKSLVQYKAAALGANDLSAETGDVWDTKYLRHESQYQTFRQHARLRYDFDGDNVIKPNETRETRTVWFGRG